MHEKTTGLEARGPIRAGALGLALLLSVVGCGRSGGAEPADEGAAAARGDGEVDGVSARIVSMAPNVTEILFALGVGDRVVGVTRYCDYPPEAKQRQHVGGYYDPSLEVIVALEPDLLIHLPEQAAAGSRLADLEVERLEVDHRTLDDVIRAIETIARRVGRVAAGENLVARLRGEIERIARMIEGRPRPRVLVSVGRTLGTGSIDEVYVAGSDGFFDRLVDLAGGRMAYERAGGAEFPKLSSEALLRIDPDVIVEIADDLDEKGLTAEAVLAEWKGLEAMRAVRGGRVHVIDTDYATIPGPRSHLLLRDLARLLHPEVDWGDP